jgi:hypothetical protein
VGPRTLETAHAVMEVTKARGRGVPACCSDGVPCSWAALLASCHTITTFARTSQRGRPRKPGKAPPPAWVYGPRIKEPPQGRRKTITRRVVLGAQRRAPRGLTIRTTRVERLTLTMRHALAPLVRTT